MMVSFFNQSFELAHNILKGLHALETLQIEQLRKQMEEHQNMLTSTQVLFRIHHKQTMILSSQIDLNLVKLVKHQYLQILL